MIRLKKAPQRVDSIQAYVTLGHVCQCITHCLCQCICSNVDALSNSMTVYTNSEDAGVRTEVITA